MAREALRLDERLLEWATPAQAATLEAINLHGGLRAAGRAIGRDPAEMGRTIKRLKLRAAAQGYSPDHDMTRTVPDPFKVKGTSTYYDSEGKVRGQWVKSTLDSEKASLAMRAAVEAMAEDLPRLRPLPAPRETEDDLCNLYTLTDSHVGMLAWHKEAGEDWDLTIAEKVLVGCFEQMVDAAPAAGVGIVSQLGDWLHYDSLSAVTPSHGHILDADGRFSKMVAAAIRILRRVIDLALQRHGEVHVILAEGNHDMASSVWLRHMFMALYENEPRVTVNDNELPYYVYQHGKVMLGFHHGHLSKNGQLPQLFAAQHAKMWGDTTKRYFHTGHRHHKDEKEHPGVTVVQHPTLAARDAYAARGGWISEREATAMTYHRQFGLVARNTVTPEMLS